MLRFRSVLASCVLVILLTAAVSAQVPFTRFFGPRIDSYQAFDPQSTCAPQERPGVVDFRHIVLFTYLQTRDLGIVRQCSVGGTSEHKEGRAWDWGVNATIPAQRVLADSLLRWVLERDPHGNNHARYRRFGLMYMIWNREIWAGYRAGEGWRSYSGDDPHTSHVHFSFGWPGARRQTTWWSPESTGTPIAGEDFGEWEGVPPPDNFDTDGPFMGTTSPFRGQVGVEDAALWLAFERQLVPLRDGAYEDPLGGFCPAERLQVSWSIPASHQFQHGGHILPLGPAPNEDTNSVNGIVYCDGSDYAYMGFEAWWDQVSQRWMVLNVPTCN